MSEWPAKPWWLSKTIIGAIATIAGQAIGLDADGVQQLTGELVTLAGAGLAIYGRVKASAPVSLRGQNDRTRPGG